MSARLLLLWPLLCCWLGGCGVLSACPWNDVDLLPWSLNSTWGSDGVPANDSKVTIPSGKKVLLDSQPNPLDSLTIEEGAALVWDNVDGLVLNTHYIYIKGAFYIGSATCKFKKRAHIRLHGTYDDVLNVTDHGFGRKFIGVAPNATFEVHGKFTTSWTKLAQTVVPLRDVDCALVYNHTNYEHNKARAKNFIKGLNVIAWNPDGSMLDFRSFTDYTKFPSFFDTIPNGRIIGMHAYGPDGIGRKTEELVGAISSLGGVQINNTVDGCGYSFLGKKGSNVSESVRSKDYQKKGSGDDLSFLSFHDKVRKIVFQVANNEYTVKKSMMFRVLNADMAFPKITLARKPKNWRTGDKVLFLSTDFDWRQAEVREIEHCKKEDCTKNQIRVNEPLSYMHYGNFTYNVDERGEVAMMSRNIVIEGVVDDTALNIFRKDQNIDSLKNNLFGGHILVAEGFKSVIVRGVQILHMGQQTRMGAYSMHFHMCRSVKGRAQFRDNFIYESFSRCLTIHGTNNLQVRGNVCFKHLGHGLFLEDGVEEGNVIQGNIIGGSMHGTLLLSDRLRNDCRNSDRPYCDAVASYWLTHSNNDIVDNVAAGGDGHGFMYSFPDRPLSLSWARYVEDGKNGSGQHSPKHMPLHKFTKNVAHSNREAGVHMDEKIATGTGMENKGNVPENGVLRVENQYDPQVKGRPVWTEMSYGTFYKNGKENMWVKAGNIKITFTAMADAEQGFSGGTTLTETGSALYNCLFIGETDNKGEPRKSSNAMNSYNHTFYGDPTRSLTGVGIYQGPMDISNNFFDQYTTVSWCEDTSMPVSQCPRDKILTRYSGALSYKRSNTYPTMPQTYASKNTFGFCDNEDNARHWLFQGNDSLTDWVWKDGNKGVYLKDTDGHLTGTANASIVVDLPFFSGDECQKRPDWGLMQVCPYRYVKLEVLGNGGNLSPPTKNDHPIYITRDDSPYDVPYGLKGEIRSEYLLRANRSYTIDFNNTKKGAKYPDEIKIYGYGVERGDVVRVGLCQPLDVKGFEVSMAYPRNFTTRYGPRWVYSLKDLDDDSEGDAFYHDKDRGMLFFKMLSNHTNTNSTQRCPAGHCFKTVIRPIGGTRGNIRNCSELYDVEAFRDPGDVKPKPTPTTPACPGIGTPEGFGPVDLSLVKDFIAKEEFSVPCIGFVTINYTMVPQRLGCYKEKVPKMEEQDLRTNEEMTLPGMTAIFCRDRCYYRNYDYAALSRGTRCTCSNKLLNSPEYEADDSLCQLACPGDTEQSCGGEKQLEVWTTGR